MLSGSLPPASFVTNVLDAAFGLARQRHGEIYRRWISASFAIGGQLPDSLLSESVQRAGEMDLILRCLEDEFALPETAAIMFKAHWNFMFAAVWIGQAYDAIRLLRVIQDESKEHDQIAHDLRLLRIALEKHQIAEDRKLTEPLKMVRQPPKGDETDNYIYSPDDPQRSHIMPCGISPRGSVVWQVVDLRANTARWIERRDLSDRILARWAPSQQSAAAQAAQS